MKRLHAIHELVAPVTVVIALGLVVMGFTNGRPWLIPAGFLFLYLFPLGLHRLQMRLTPIPIGRSEIGKAAFHPWLASHRIQKLFIALPALEAVLSLVPGLYPAWLRAWGAEIGRGVYFAPSVRIHDRSLVEIGDYCVIGDETVIVSHMVTRKAGRTLVLCQPVRIGVGKLIGGYSLLPAGCHIDKLDQLPTNSLCPVGSTDEFFSVAQFGMNQIAAAKRAAKL